MDTLLQTSAALDAFLCGPLAVPAVPLFASAAHLLARLGLPSWVRPALGISEILAAILFLVPFTTVVGGYLLLVVFGLAAMVHVLHGQYGIGELVVYGVAALVCLVHRRNTVTEVPHE